MHWNINKSKEKIPRPHQYQPCRYWLSFQIIKKGWWWFYKILYFCFYNNYKFWLTEINSSNEKNKFRKKVIKKIKINRKIFKKPIKAFLSGTVFFSTSPSLLFSFHSKYFYFFFVSKNFKILRVCCILNNHKLKETEGFLNALPNTQRFIHSFAHAFICVLNMLLLLLL